jgi:hypothetical protein
MTDLTKIDRPFGLLDEATQKALRECGGPWEWFMGGRWEDIEPMFASHVTYRQKPQPSKPRECWIIFLPGRDDPWRYGYWTEEEAKGDAARLIYDAEVIHVREVIE